MFLVVGACRCDSKHMFWISWKLCSHILSLLLLSDMKKKKMKMYGFGTAWYQCKYKFFVRTFFVEQTWLIYVHFVFFPLFPDFSILLYESRTKKRSLWITHHIIIYEFAKTTDLDKKQVSQVISMYIRTLTIIFVTSSKNSMQEERTY